MAEIKMINDNEKIQTTLAHMEAGESVAFSAHRMRSVKTLSSDYGFQSGRKYTTRINRENRTIEVTRTI